MYEAIITIAAFLLLLWAGSLHLQLKSAIRHLAEMRLAEKKQDDMLASLRGVIVEQEELIQRLHNGPRN